MNRALQIRSLLLIVGISLVASQVYADIPKPPDPPPKKSTDKPVRFFKVTTDPGKEVSYLKIPRHEFEAIVAENARKQTSLAPLKTQSIIAALAASIGLASVFLLRMNRSTKIAMLFVIGLIASGAAAQAWWNAPPPYPRFPIDSRSKTAALEHQGKLVVEVTENGSIELFVGTGKPTP